MATSKAALHEVKTIESKNPTTGEIVGEVPFMGESEVQSAASRARLAQSTWAAMSPSRRREELLAWRRMIADRAEDFVDVIHAETAKPRFDALGEVMLALTHLNHAASRAEKVLRPRKVGSGIMPNFKSSIRYVPYGIVGVIGPWNYPLFTPMGSISSALAAGNAVVFKPSEETPLVGRLLEETAAQCLSVANLFQVVTGDGSTGAALIRSGVHKLSFTGSPDTARKVMSAAAEELIPVVLELGGKDAMIVAADADVEKAAEAAVFGAIHNTGQACVSIERCFVAEAVYSDFVDKVRDNVNDIKTAQGADSQIGAMTFAPQVDIIRDHLEDAVDKGARVLCGGPDKIDGNRVMPTVLLDVTPEMKIMREETFGPVLPIVRVADAAEGVRFANDSKYGLGSSIFGKAGIRELAHSIRSGMTAINAVMAFSTISSLPFGGIAESGFGRIHGDEGLREFCYTKSMAEQRFALPVNLTSFRLPDNAYDQVKSTIAQFYGGGVVDKAGSVIRKLRS